MVLWMLMILGVIGLSYAGMVRTHVQVSRLRRGRVEAWWAARAGIEKARARLAALDSLALTANDPLFDDIKAFRNQSVGRARFSLLAPPADEKGDPRYGIIDESARLNINTADEAALLRLPNMTEELAQCLLDWRDEDDAALAAGAESDYYADLSPPYAPRNGALASLEELRLVRGWDEVLALARPDPYQKFNARPREERPMLGRSATRAAKLNAAESRKLLNLLTAWSAGAELAPDGQKKLDLAQAGADEIRRRIPTLSQEEAQAIVEHRKAASYTSATDLLNVMITRQGQAPAKAFDLKRVGEIIDTFAVGAGGEPSGLVNVNTAPREVLLTVPGLDEPLTEQLIDARAREPFKGAGGILGSLTLNEDAFRKLYPRITATGGRYRVVARGTAAETEAAVTIEAVVAVAERKTSICYWRELYQP